MVFFGQNIINAIFGALVGLIYFQSDTSFKTGIQNRYLHMTVAYFQSVILVMKHARNTVE